VVEIPDDDAPPPEWGQWENWPAPAPEPAAGVLVMDDCVMSRRPTHGAKASSSRAGLPAPDVAVARPEQEQGHTSAPPAHFDEAQAEQALWQKISRPRRLAQQRAERGAADPWRSRVANLPGMYFC
jgi:hypothetical protein